MQFFALETNVHKTKARFLAPGEREIFLVHRHIMSFMLQVFWEILITIALVVAFTYLPIIGIVSPLIATIGFLVGWFGFVFFGLIRGFLDWKFDFLFLSTDKLIILDQTSLFKKTITPINLENLGDVVSQTQWMDLFGFGIVRVKLKEGATDIVMKYMPNADTLVSKISQQITLYQRRKDYIVPYRPRDDAH